jgi:hypothetical protein
MEFEHNLCLISGENVMSDSEEHLIRLAVAEFGLKFAEYVKEVDLELWKRAVDYATDYTKVEGVEFKKNESNNDEK